VTQDSIKSIGEGRVWDAITAKQIGLVDEFGGLEAAVKWIAKKAKLGDNDYSVVDYPTLELSFMDMLSSYPSAVTRDNSTSLNTRLLAI
jgi:protease-4